MQDRHPSSRRSSGRRQPINILERLSSACGDPSEASNKAVAAEALACPETLDEVAAGLALDDHRLLGDCAVIALGEYGRSGPEAAWQAFPLLRAAMEAWESKHARLALEGMDKLLAVEPALGPEVQAAAQTCLDHKRANVRRLAHKMVQR